MSIASEITRLQGAKSTLKTKLNAKNDEQHQITNETIDEYGDFVDSIQSSNIIGATAEGESLNLVNTKAMPYSDYVVEGKSEQEEKPSPSNPSEIHSVADDVNLFDETQLLQASGWTASNNIYSGLIDNWFSKFKNGFLGLSFKNSTQYTLSFKGATTGGSPRIKVVYSDNTSSLINISSSTLTNYSYTSTAGKTISSIQSDFGSGSSQTLSLSEFQLEEGSVATPYSPYNQGTVTIKQRGTTENNDYTIQTFPLRSLPNGVKDTIEADGIHRRVGRIVFDGTENWTSYTVLQNNIAQGGITLSPKAKSRIGYCNNFPVVADYSSTEHIVIAGGLTAVYIHIDQTRLNTQDLAGFKEWLSNNPVILQYELDQETIEPLTQNQATTMLDIIKTGSYEGTTNIDTDEDVKPTIGVDYYKYGETGGLPTVENEKLIFDKELQIDREELIF